MGTRRRNDVDATSLRRIDVVTTSCACWEFGPPPPKILNLGTPNILNLPTPMKQEHSQKLTQFNDQIPPKKPRGKSQHKIRQNQRQPCEVPFPMKMINRLALTSQTISTFPKQAHPQNNIKLLKKKNQFTYILFFMLGLALNITRNILRT